MTEKYPSEEFQLLLRAYERIAERNTAEQERLYHLVVGYIAGAAGALTWLLGVTGHFKTSHLRALQNQPVVDRVVTISCLFCRQPVCP